METYSTDDDLMAVFIGDECRALSRRSGDAEAIYFVLNIYSNPSSDPEYFILCYYSGGLRQKFVLKDEIRFLNEKNLGTEDDFILDLLSGTTKYAWVTELTVKPKPKEGITIDSDADLVGVFVNGDCRGKGKPGMPFSVFLQ